MLKRKISYKTSIIVFTVLLLLATTVINVSLKAGQNRTNRNSLKTAQIDDKESNQQSGTDTNEDKDNINTENTSDTTQTDSQTNSDSTSTTNPPTSQPPLSQPPSTESPPQPPPPPPPTSSGQTITVTINSSGNYSPLNPTINKGDTIK